MTILLIVKTPIIKQIVTLVSKKLALDLTTTNTCVVDNDYDIIIAEDICIDKSFPIASMASSYGVISKEKIDSDCNFFIPKPFLPSSLFDILDEQKKILEVPPVLEVEEKVEQKEEKDEVVESLEFIESLADNIYDEIEEESDESVVSGAFMDSGGVLDKNELSKLKGMLDDSAIEEVISQDDEDEWIDLANIIDKAIDEVREYNFVEDEPIRVKLNEYSINEISPLLNKLGQNIVDELTGGKEITLKLKVESE